MQDWKLLVFLIASGQGLLLSIALFSKFDKQHKANPYLGLILFILSLELLTYWAIFSGYTNTKDAIPFWLIQSYLVIPPSLWLFIQMNANRKISYLKKTLLYIPALLEITIESAFYIYFRITGHHINLLEIKIWHFLTEISPIFWTTGVLIFYGKTLFINLKNNDNIRSESVFQTGKHLSFFIVFSLITLLWAIGEFTQLNIYIYLNFILVVLLFGLGYIGYYNPEFFHIPKSVSVAFPSYNDQMELNRLKKVIEEKSLYAQPRLSLKKLAEELDLPSRYVSYLINRYCTTNFHTFVNSYRVKEVINKIKDPSQKHKSLLALAYEAGFNSKSAFNQIFKEHTGQLPSDYLS